MADPVIFRFDRDGELTAFMPHASANRGNIVCYAHIGQHGEASLGYYNGTRKPRTVEELQQIAELRRELEGIGYEVDQYQRLPRNWRSFAWNNA